MTVSAKKQLTVLGIFIFVYALLAFATYLFIPLDQLAGSQALPATMINIRSPKLMQI